MLCLESQDRMQLLIPYRGSMSALAILRKLRCITDEKCQPGMFWSKKV